MTRREWIGNYQLDYEIYLPHNDSWVSRTSDLGRCLGRDEAIERAVAFFVRENITPNWNKVTLTDGWGNTFKATEN